MPLLRKRKIPLKAGDIMSVPPITISRDASLKEAAKLMKDKDIGSLIVVGKEGKVEGIITERDLVFALAESERTGELQVWMYMTENPLTVAPHTPIVEALNIMRNSNIRHLPVVEKDGSPVGMISIKDILEAVALLFSTLVSE
jgi:CBS domain-containing protein